MKKILFVLAAVMLALTGCGRNSAAKAVAGQEKTERAAHSHNHDHSSHSHDCGGHDHAGHDHSAHAGQADHSACEGHDHSHEAHKGHMHTDACAGHDHSHEGHAHDAVAGHSHGDACENHDHSHDAHAGHSHDDHSHDAHAGHDHSASKKQAGKVAASADPHAGHSHAKDKKTTKKAAKADPHAGHDHGPTEAVDHDEIVFPPAQAARADFQVQPARRGTFREVVKCGGQVTAAQGEITVVTAPIAGVVTPYDGRIMASTTVRKGQELFNLSSGGLASGDAIKKARINYEQAEANYERVKELYKDKLVTQRDYLAAQSEYLTAKEEYEPVRRSDGRGGTIITSPADGYITGMEVSAGDFVEMGQPLATIARSGKMQLRALVSQRYFDRLASIDDANFRVASSGEYFNVSSLGGSLYSAGRIVSSGSALIPVVFEFTGNGAIPDGAYAEVALLGREREGVMTLPLTAITEQQGLYYIYVQLDEECYSRREVRLGADDGVRVEVISGVSENDRVVTRGAINVKMAAASGAIPHGHSH